MDSGPTHSSAGARDAGLGAGETVESGLAAGAVGGPTALKPACGHGKRQQEAGSQEVPLHVVTSMWKRRAIWPGAPLSSRPIRPSQ